MHADDAAGLSLTNDHPSLTLDLSRLLSVVQAVIAGEEAQVGDVSIVLSDAETVHRLNRQYLQHDYPTDVLAFDLRDSDEAPLEGEVYVDLDMARDRHAEFRSSFEVEAMRYAVHGLLHLIGHSDDTPEGKNRMHELENLYLQRAGETGTGPHSS